MAAGGGAAMVGCEDAAARAVLAAKVASVGGEEWEGACLIFCLNCE